MLRELAELLGRHRVNLPALLGEIAGFAPVDAERRVRLNPLVRHGLVQFKSGWLGGVELQLGWSLVGLLDNLPEGGDGIIEAMVGTRYDAGLPLDAFPAVGRWYARLEAIDAWRDPFQGLDAPELPPVPAPPAAAP